VRESALIDKQCDAITCFVASALPKIMAAGINPRVSLQQYGLPSTPLAHHDERYFAKEGVVRGDDHRPVRRREIRAAQSGGDDRDLFKEVPEMKLASTAKEQLEIGMACGATTRRRKRSTRRGLRRPAVYVKMTDLIFENASAAGDKSRSASLYTNEFVGKLRLSDAEWRRPRLRRQVRAGMSPRR